MSSEEATNEDDVSGDKDQSKNNSPYEPKEKPKLIRVLTVLAYMLSVSMAAILLSVYYVFVWDAHPHIGSLIQDKPIDDVDGSYGKFDISTTTTATVMSIKSFDNRTNSLGGIVAERLENPINFTTSSTLSTPTTPTLSITTDMDIIDEDLPERFAKRSIFMKKLLYKRHVNDIMQ